MKENKKIPKVMHSNSLTVDGYEQGGNKLYCERPEGYCDKAHTYYCHRMCEFNGV